MRGCTNRQWYTCVVDKMQKKKKRKKEKGKGNVWMKEMQRIRNHNLKILPQYFHNCKDTIRNEPNWVGFTREKAQTMSFVEHGFERLDLDHQVMGFSWSSYKIK